MRKLIIIIYLIFIIITCYSANDRLDLSIKNIPDSLTKSANAVIRISTTEFEYKSPIIGIEKHAIAITVLDKKGKDISDFHYSGDKFRNLKNFSGKLYDADGIFLRKFKLSDVNSTEWSSELASDAKHFFFDCDTPTYPFTIVYEYEVDWKNGTLVFPAFVPQFTHHLSVEKANYKLTLPENVEFRTKTINYSAQPKKTTTKGISILEWKVENHKAVPDETFDPDLIAYIPLIYLCPKNFIYDGVPGNISDWKSMGIWENELLKGRNQLSDETKAKILELTKNSKSDKEKVKILYDYLGQTTRYVNISLGIGGYQPMPAAEVVKTGFGDCKALSNYLKSMLEVVNVQSNYTGIKLDESDKTLFADYPNFNQMNHIILQVPLQKDTLWLECTNPRVPFGFVHNGISGHDALVDTKDGGKITRLPDYPDSLNIEKNNIVIELNPDGSANATMKKNCHVKVYDHYDWFPLASNSKQADYLREEINLANVTIGKIQTFEDKSPKPALFINYTWSTPLYGNKTGNRLFIPINPYRSINDNLKKKKRYHDIKIENGYKDIDSIYISIPEGFEIETMPSNYKISTLFGMFNSKLELSGKGILIQQMLFIPSGEYKVSTYPELVDFFDKIGSAYKNKIIFRKKTA